MAASRVAVRSRVQVPGRFERWSAVQAREALSEHKESGLSLAAFARRQGLPLHRLQWWRARLNDDSHEQTAPVRLVPVTIRATPASSSLPPGIELEIRGGRLLRIAGPFDPDLLVRLVRALELTGC
jgi:hypothetical protein